jgi:hypothetical protein
MSSNSYIRLGDCFGRRIFLKHVLQGPSFDLCLRHNIEFVPLVLTGNIPQSVRVWFKHEPNFSEITPQMGHFSARINAMEPRFGNYLRR